MKIEMHAHTSEGSPCAETEAVQIVKAYSDAGYDALVITNHFDHQLLKGFGKTGTERIERYLLGYRNAKSVEARYNIKVMLGIEIRLEPDEEDFLIYGIDENFLFQHPNLCFLSQKELYTLCRSHGAVLYQAHPFRTPCVPRDPAYLDGIELNQRPNSGNHNERLTAWVQNYPKLKFISGSDCHNLAQVGFGGIITEQEADSIQELVEILKHSQIKMIINKNSVIETR